MFAHQNCIEMINFDGKMSRADEEEKKIGGYNECVDIPVGTLPFDKHHRRQDEKNAVYSYVSMRVKPPVNAARDSQDVPYASASQTKPVRAAMSLESAMVEMIRNHWQWEMVLEGLGFTVTIRRKRLIAPPISHTIASPRKSAPY